MNFDLAIERVLGREAGYVNDPRDPEGETKWGISKRSYPRLDIKKQMMTELKNWPARGKGRVRRIALNLRYGA